MDLSASDDLAIDRVVGLLRQSRSLLFITGAGMSADSGLPTYRGVGGLYNVNNSEDGYPIEELLSGRMLRRRPELTWKYLGQIERACRGTRHNRGHVVIAEMDKHFERVWVLTQNVDGFHRQAGSKNVIDIHGDLHDLLCTACGAGQTVADYSALEPLPRCGACGHPLRPDVVLFGEMLPERKLMQLYQELAEGFDLIFSIGTTSVFPYISEPVSQASRAGVPTVEINPGESDVSRIVTVRLPMRAAEALDAIWERFRNGAALS